LGKWLNAVCISKCLSEEINMVEAKVAFARHSEVEHAIAVAAAAQPAWGATNPQRRARVMFKFLELVHKEFDSLAALLSSEHGKTLADSRGDIQRGLEVVEFACGVPHLLKGEYSTAAGPGIDLIRCDSRSASSPASRRSIFPP
jgi:malonate-semialdehyde dehydrogenase (acetylating)/methylmalonate-semialdehyde dehydrogenase